MNGVTRRIKILHKTLDHPVSSKRKTKQAPDPESTKRGVENYLRPVWLHAHKATLQLPPRHSKKRKKRAPIETHDYMFDASHLHSSN